MKKALKWILIVGFVLLAAAQLVPVARTNPAVDEAKTIQRQLQVPADVSQIMTRSCADCHTHTTKWPWYAYVAPVSWFVAKDVKDGRRHMNLSNWNMQRSKKRLEEICEQVTMGEMPVPAYTWMHKDAKLSQSDKDALCNWSKAEMARAPATPAQPAPADKEKEEEHKH